MPDVSRRALLASLFAGESSVRRAPAAFDTPSEPAFEPGFSLVPLAPGSATLLRWPRSTLRGPAMLRVAIARDDRAARLLRARLAQSGEDVGAFDIRFSCVFEPFDLSLDARDAEAAQRQGLRLTLEGGETPLSLLVPTTANAHGLAPQLWQAGSAEPEDEFIRRLASLDSLQQFSWMEGCVLEGLNDFGLKDA